MSFEIIYWITSIQFKLNKSRPISNPVHSREHYNDVIMSPTASQITSLTIVFSTVYSDADQRKHQSSASLAFVRGIHRGPVNSPHKWPVTRKMFPFDDVIMSSPWKVFFISIRCCILIIGACLCIHMSVNWVSISIYSRMVLLVSKISIKIEILSLMKLNYWPFYKPGYINKLRHKWCGYVSSKFGHSSPISNQKTQFNSASKSRCKWWKFS